MSWFSRSKPRTGTSRVIIIPALSEGVPEAVSAVLVESSPIDEDQWARWVASATEHDLSPLRISLDERRVQRHCVCGWVTPLCDTSDETIAAHRLHRREL